MAKAKDCLEVSVQALTAEAVDLEAMRQEIIEEIDAAVAQALAEAEPDPAQEDGAPIPNAGLTKDWYHERQRDDLLPAAIRQALGDEMAADDSVFIYGEDVGGSFGGGRNHQGPRFPGRVMNTPISEDAITGVAIGAAMEGARPIIEFQFADFASVAFIRWSTTPPPPIGGMANPALTACFRWRHPRWRPFHRKCPSPG